MTYSTEEDCAEQMEAILVRPYLPSPGALVRIEAIHHLEFEEHERRPDQYPLPNIGSVVKVTGTSVRTSAYLSYGAGWVMLTTKEYVIALVCRVSPP